MEDILEGGEYSRKQKAEKVERCNKRHALGKIQSFLFEATHCQGVWRGEPGTHRLDHAEGWKEKGGGYPETEGAARGEDPESEHKLRSNPWLTPEPGARGEDTGRPCSERKVTG